jgi:hypothetical protein
VARQIAHQASPVQDATRSRAEAAADFAHDVAYGRSDWQRAGRAIVGSDQYEDASAGRRAAAVVGGVALGGLALASWIPGFNVFKPAQAARAARAFGAGAEAAGQAGKSMVAGGYRQAREVERQRKAAIAAKKAADAPLTEAGLAAETAPVYRVDGFRHLGKPFDETEKIAVQTNLTQRAINAVDGRLRQIASRNPDHPIVNNQRYVDQLGEARVIDGTRDMANYSVLGDNPISRGSDTRRFIYTLGDDQPQVTRLDSVPPGRMVLVPEVTGEFLDYTDSISTLYTPGFAGTPRGKRLAEGLFRHERNAIFGSGNQASIVTVFDNLDEAFSAAAARGRPYVHTPEGYWVRVPDTYWPDRPVGKNILSKYGTKTSRRGKPRVPARAEQFSGVITERGSHGGFVDQIPRGSNADLLMEVLRDQGFDGLPLLGSADDIARLRDEGYLILHRGITSVDSPAQAAARLGQAPPPADNTRALDWVNKLFTRSDYYAGTGSHGAGMYFTPHMERAVGYSEGYGAVVTMALPPTARIMGPGEFADLSRQMLKAWAENPSYGAARGAGLLDGFTATPMQMDMGRIIAMLGYDGYIPYNTVFGYYRPELVLLNRSIAVFDRVADHVWGGLP